MADTCPPIRSCGTSHPIWSDEDPPERILNITTVKAYIRNQSSCKHTTLIVEVMRCSQNTGYDLIYRYVGTYTDNDCKTAFCSMGFSFG